MSRSSGRRCPSVAWTAAARFWDASSMDWVASRLMRTSTIPYGARWMCAVRVSNMAALDDTKGSALRRPVGREAAPIERQDIGDGHAVRRNNERGIGEVRSEENTSELQSHSFISYAVFC